VFSQMEKADEVCTPSSPRAQSGEREPGGVAGGVISTPQAKALPPQAEKICLRVRLANDYGVTGRRQTTGGQLAAIHRRTREIGFSAMLVLLKGGWQLSSHD
jgi:hypothetical protein